MTHTIPGEEARAPVIQADVLQRAVEHGHTCLSTISRDTKHVQIERAVLRTLLAFAHQSPSRAAGESIPARMKPWHGGKCAPADWEHPLPVQFRDGAIGYESDTDAWYWGHDGDQCDIIAYTPKATPQTVPANAELPGREYLLLASYCGDDNDACTDQRPCDDCLAMCNVFRVADAEPTFARELGRLLSAPR